MTRARLKTCRFATDFPRTSRSEQLSLPAEAGCQVGEQPGDRRLDLRLRLGCRCPPDLLEDGVGAALDLADQLEAVDALDGWDRDDRGGEPERRRLAGDVQFLAGEPRPGGRFPQEFDSSWGAPRVGGGRLS